MITLRQIEPADIDALSLVFMKAYQGIPWEESWTREESKGRLEDILHNPKAFGFVLLSEGKPVGAALGRQLQFNGCRKAELEECFLDPDCQKQGYGGQPIRAFLQECRLKDIRDIYLITHQGYPLEDFYRHFGFRPEPKTCLLHLFYGN